MKLRDLFPDSDRVIVRVALNQSALHSFWLGLTVPLIHLPMLVWGLVLVPTGRGLWALWNTIVGSIAAGITGHVHVKD